MRVELPIGLWVHLSAVWSMNREPSQGVTTSMPGGGLSACRSGGRRVLNGDFETSIRRAAVMRSPLWAPLRATADVPEMGHRRRNPNDWFGNCGLNKPMALVQTAIRKLARGMTVPIASLDIDDILSPSRNDRMIIPFQ